ncbi:MAG: hypothetical protein WD037_00580 [Balneolales bacterium]
MIRTKYHCLSKYLLLLFLLLFVVEINKSVADDGYRMWLRYDLIQDANHLQNYRAQLKQVLAGGKSFPILHTRELR